MTPVSQNTQMGHSAGLRGVTVQAIACHEIRWTQMRKVREGINAENTDC